MRSVVVLCSAGALFVSGCFLFGTPTNGHFAGDGGDGGLGGEAGGFGDGAPWEDAARTDGEMAWDGGSDGADGSTPSSDAGAGEGGAADAPDDAPACVTAPVYSAPPGCNSASSWTSPGHFCLTIFPTSGPVTEVVTTTPAQCASWCTYHCGCLIDAGVCGALNGTCNGMTGYTGVENVGCH